MKRFEAIVEDAVQLAADAKWGPAAIAWARAAAIATEHQARESARQAWDQAGETWRRDDRLDSAARALKMALGLADEPMPTAMAQVKLSGVLGEMGRYAEAEALCRRASDVLGPDSPLRPIVMDTWVTNLSALGRKDEARELVDQLLELDGVHGLAGHFRRAQLCRLDGELSEGALHLGMVIDGLAAEPRAIGAVAAAHAELGEVALLRGDIEQAVHFFEQAFAGQQAAKRPSLKWRAEAARIRVMLAGGVEPLTHSLDEGVAYAQDRDMLVLEADLRIARGMALAHRLPVDAGHDLEAAAAISDEARCPLRSGRARLMWASRIDNGGPVERRISVMQRAEEQLESSRPWVARARFERARLIADRDPTAARALAVGALTHFTAMEMALDQALASVLVQSLT